MLASRFVTDLNGINPLTTVNDDSSQAHLQSIFHCWKHVKLFTTVAAPEFPH